MTHPSEPPPAPAVYACLQCVGERKAAEADDKPEADLPPLQIAVTLAPMPTPFGVVVVPLCYGHITVTKSSPLMAANGAGLPPGLHRPPPPRR